jgi:hypothetical protein
MQSKANDFLCYKGRVVFVVYVDYRIVVSPNQSFIEDELTLIRTKLDILVEGDIRDYVGVNVQQTDDRKIKMTQLNIFKSILKEMGFNEYKKEKINPTYSSAILTYGLNIPKHQAE